jgi:hypothetical protein
MATTSDESGPGQPPTPAQRDQDEKQPERAARGTRFVAPPRFYKALKKKPKDLQGAILRCMERLDEDPRHPGLQTHRIKGTIATWEAYIDKANRITFEYGPDGEIQFLNHCNHDIIKKATF